MSDTEQIDDGGPAFPVTQADWDDDDFSGMTLRDWFAGQALAGLVQNGKYASGQIADAAYSFADSMLAARKEKR